MKRFILLFFVCIMTYPIQCQTVTIGTGNATQKQPFGMWASYERSAALYLASEIGSFGSYGMMINTLGWNVGTGSPTTCPTRIYLKTTSSTNLSPTTWASITAGATLVYDASTNFTSAGWRTLDIANFAYTTGNLLVLCETNYGGNGATFYPIFKLSYYPNKHEYWYEYDIPPSGNGSVNENRPNIQINYTSIPGPVVPPSGFIALAVSSSLINLNWKKNAANDEVMLACNSVNTFGVPSGTYSAGDNIAGGGTVIYKGSGTMFSHTEGLNPGTIYYYQAWSVHPPVPEYSIATNATATTFCDVVSVFPYIADFEASVFPPSCWSLSALPWLRSSVASGYGTGSASVYANFFNSSAGDFELESPELDFSSLISTMVTFDHAYATYNTQVDKLELLYSNDNGVSFNSLITYLGGPGGPLNTGGATTSNFIPAPGQWATKSVMLPDGTNKIMFRGISAFGNNLYLDNITFHGLCPGPTMLVANSVTATGVELVWTPVGTAGEWEIKYGPAGFDTLSGGTLIPGITSIPFFLDGLEPGQNYDVYVRTNCGGGTSYWEGPLAVITLCETVNVPFNEDFDSFTPPETGCFEVTDNNEDFAIWITSPSCPASPPNSIFIGQNTQIATNDWFFSPGINLLEGVNYSLNFVYRGAGGNNIEKLEVNWGYTPDAGSMTGGQIWNDQEIQTITYKKGIAVFTPVLSDVYYFGWHAFSVPGDGFISVDNINLDVTFVTWTGYASNDWGDPANWLPEFVPSQFQNVTIPSNSPFYPVVQVTGLACNDLTIDPDAFLTIDPAAELTVQGNLLIKEGASLDNQGLIVLEGNLENQNLNQD